MHQGGAGRAWQEGLLAWGMELNRPRRARGKKISAHWIIHILAIKDEEKFFAHLSLANSKTKYGGKTRIFAPVKATLKETPSRSARSSSSHL